MCTGACVCVCANACVSVLSRMWVQSGGHTTKHCVCKSELLGRIELRDESGTIGLVFWGVIENL